jgi:ligand-binding SRPBCC domain-containing protein
MKLYALKTKQRLPIDLATAWAFFSSPRNPRAITPEHLSFEITTKDLPEKMYPGIIISYSVRPVLGIPLSWVTEITQIQEPHYFVDEQRFGPYSLWHHKHFFTEIPGGVEMTDEVHYVIPFGIFGRLLHVLFIRRQLENIFAFRTARLHERFGEYKA